ncbi:hypothetical protein A1354_00955 [Pseudomonas asplenii]|nr:hypothetical protein A1354_00955 [Pseudomonas asplenii]
MLALRDKVGRILTHGQGPGNLISNIVNHTQYITLVALWKEDNQTVGSLGKKLFRRISKKTSVRSH